MPSPIAAGNDVNKIMEHKEMKGKKKKRLWLIQLYFYHEDIMV